MNVYDILLYTPLGKKQGELRAKIGNGRLLGFLSLFGHTEPIEGTVDENGVCSLQGSFITLLNTVAFTADGTISPDALHLAVKGGGGCYEMLGTLRRQEGCDRK